MDMMDKIDLGFNIFQMVFYAVVILYILKRWND